LLEVHSFFLDNSVFVQFEQIAQTQSEAMENTDYDPQSARCEIQFCMLYLAT
jgi:hypothetical protein